MAFIHNNFFEDSITINILLVTDFLYFLHMTTSAGVFMFKYHKNRTLDRTFVKVLWRYAGVTSHNTVILYSLTAVFPYYLIGNNLSIIKMITLLETGTLTTFYGVILNVGRSNSDDTLFEEDA